MAYISHVSLQGVCLPQIVTGFLLSSNILTVSKQGAEGWVNERAETSPVTIQVSQMCAHSGTLQKKSKLALATKNRRSPERMALSLLGSSTSSSDKVGGEVPWVTRDAFSSTFCQTPDTDSPGKDSQPSYILSQVSIILGYPSTSPIGAGILFASNTIAPNPDKASQTLLWPLTTQQGTETTIHLLTRVY